MSSSLSREYQSPERNFNFAIKDSVLLFKRLSMNLSHTTPSYTGCNDIAIDSFGKWRLLVLIQNTRVRTFTTRNNLDILCVIIVHRTESYEIWKIHPELDEQTDRYIDRYMDRHP